MQRDNSHKVAEADGDNHRHKDFYEILAPIRHIVRCEERAYHIAYAVNYTKGIIDIAHNHKYRQRERCGKQNYEALDCVGYNHIHSHQPKSYRQDKVS